MADDSSGPSNSVPPGGGSAPSTPPGRRTSLRPEAIAPALEGPLRDEELLLESLVGALSHGESMPEQWEALHAAAARDDKIAELAFAYEKLTDGTRFRVLSAGNRVEIHLHAAEFLFGVFGDADGAVQHAERALEINPADERAFERLRGLLLGSGDAMRLVRLYLARLPHVGDAPQRVSLLRTALEQVESMPQREDASLPLLEELSKLEPGDDGVQRELGQRYIAEGRTKEAVKLFEAELASEPSSSRAQELQRWLIRAYSEDLGQPHKAIGFLEDLLERDPDDAYALNATEQLLEQRTVAPRAAAALSKLYQRKGQTQDAASMLTLELRLATGSRRAEAQRELAVLKQDHLDDPKGARDLLEPLVSRDPSDDDLRERYVGLSAILDRRVDAARLLSRSAHSAKEPDAKARVLTQVGRLFLQCGDERRAMASYQSALETGADDPAVLRAAKELCELYSRVGDNKRLAKALEQVVQREQDPAERHPAAERLARLCDETGDKKLGVSAWSALLDSDQAEQALERLEALSTELADDAGLARVLEKRAELSRSGDEAREFIVRAATLRGERLGDREGAVRTWWLAVERYGAGLEALQKLVPLLEAQRDYEGLARALRHRAGLEEGEERAKSLARAGQVLSDKLGDPGRALELFGEALTTSPKQSTAIAALERWLNDEDLAARAAEALRRAAEASGDRRLKVSLLEWEARVAQSVEERLGALRAAVDLLQEEPRDSVRIHKLASQGLWAAVVDAPSLASEWLSALQTEAERSQDFAPYCETLTRALGAQPIASQELFLLATALGEALASLGEVARAIEVLRRAHAYDPTSPGLVARIEELLAEGGSPEERLTFYREALLQPGSPERQKKLQHALARLLRRELADTPKAIAVWQQILEADPADPLAHTSLLGALRETERFHEAYAESVRALPFLEQGKRSDALAAAAELAVQVGDVPAALDHYRALLDAGALEGSWLGDAERLGMQSSDWSFLTAVLERKLQLTEEPSLALRILDRLAQVASERVEDTTAAAGYWRRAATLAENDLGDARLASEFLRRVLRVSSDDVEAAQRLLALMSLESDWSEMPGVFQVVLAEATGPVATAQVQQLEPRAQHPSTRLVLADLARAVRSGFPEADVEALLALEARSLAAQPEHADRAAECFRAFIALGEPSEDRTRAFEVFLGAQEAPRADDWRWLFELRVKAQEDPTPILVEWAAVEEQRLGCVEEARRLLERVLEQEPDHEEALGDAARLASRAGEPKQALVYLGRLRDRAQGEARILADLAYARVLIEGTGDVEAGLEVLHSVLTKHPTQPEALELVKQVLVQPNARAQAAELLDRISQELEDREAGREILETLLSVSKDTPELAERRQEWFLQVVEYRESEQPEGALELCLEAAQENPAEEAVWDVAERLARKLETPEPVRDAYNVALAQATDGDLAELLGRRLIDFYEEWFDEPDRVIELLERVLDGAPTAAWALDRLKLAFNAAGRWQDLFRVYDRAIARSEETFERESLLEEAALAAKDFAGDAPRAIGYLEQLLELRRDDSRVENNLERLYEREGQSRPLIELLGRRLDKLSGTPLEELRLRIAGLWIDLSDARHAFELIDLTLEAGPGTDEAFQLLERILALPVPPESLPPTGDGSRRRRAMSVRDDVAARLKAHYESLGQTQDVVRMLEVELEAAPGKAELEQRLGELVTICLNRLDDPRSAFKHLMELVGLVPSSQEYRGQLDELAQRIDEGQRQAELLVMIAGREESPLAEQLFYEAGEVSEREQLFERAVDLHHRVAHAAGAPVELQLKACRRLDPLLERAGELPRRVDLLERIAALGEQVVGAEAERVGALATAARLADQQLTDLERAIRLWRELLAIDPRDGGALDGLVDALRRAEHHTDLVAALDERAGLRVGNGDAQGARQDRVWAAKVLGENLGQTASAVERWVGIEQDHGADEESFETLVQLLEREQRWPELAARIEREAEGTADPTPRAALLVRLAELYATHTGQITEALHAYAAADDWDGAISAVRGVSDAEAGLAACGELYQTSVRYWKRSRDQRVGEVAHWAVTEQRNRLLERGRHQAVVELLEEASELDFPVEIQRGMRQEAALLCQERLGAPERAAEIFSRLLDEDPADDVAQASVPRLALLLDELGRSEAKVKLWEQQAGCRERLEDRGGAAALWSRAAQLAETELKDVERALVDFRAGAALGGEDCLEALARIHEARGETQERVEVLEWLCASSGREQVGERTLRLAQGYEELGRRDRARARLEAVLTQMNQWRGIDAAPVRKHLSELYRADKAWVPLAELLAEEARRATLKRKRRKLFEEAATLFMERVGNSARAIPLLESALEAEPEDVDLRLALVDALCDEEGGTEEGFERAEQLLRDQLELYGTRRPKSRALVHHRLARVLKRSEGSEAALRELEVAAKIDPAHPEVLEELGRVAFDLGRGERAERAFRALLLVLKPGSEPATKGPSRSEAFVYLGEIAALRDDPIRATEFIESAFEAAMESDFESKRLERALRQRGRHELLARVVETRLERASNPAETARALADLVMLYAEDGQAAQAERAGRIKNRADDVFQSLEQQQADSLAWSALGQVYEWLGDRERETHVLERRVAAQGLDNADAEALYRLAELRLGSGETRDSGIDLLERALELEADLPRADGMLRGLLEREPGVEEPARLLESISRSAGREESLLFALRHIAALPGPRIDVLREAWELASRLEQLDVGRKILEEALAREDAGLEGEDGAWVRLQLSELLEVQGAQAKALELKEQAALLMDPANARDLCLEIARQAEEQGQLDRAVRVLERVRQDNPADREAWEPLMALCRERGDLAKLAELIESTLAVVDDAESRGRLALERARILLGRGDTRDAIDVLRQIVEDFPGTPEASETLIEVLQGEGRREELVEILVGELERAKDEQSVERITSLSLRLGALLEELERQDDAFDVYQALMDWAPDAVEALRRSVSILETRDDSYLLADAIERLLPLEQGEAASALGRRLMDLRREQGDEEAEERALRLLFDAEPRDREVAERLSALYAGRADFSSQADILARCFEANPHQADLLSRLVEAHRQAGELDRALEALSVALTLKANHVGLLRQRAELLESLERPLDALDDHERVYAQEPAHGVVLCEALQRALEAAEGDARRGIQKRLVAVYEELGDGDGAQRVLTAVLEERPDDRDALWRLARLARRTQNDTEMASHYLQRLCELERGERLIQAIAELLEVCNETGQLEHARAGLERAVELYPEDPELSERLRELYQALGATRELAHMMLRDAGEASELEARYQLLVRAGQLLSGPGGHLGEAIGVLEQARALVPDELEGIAALGRAYASAGRAADARALLAEGVASQRGRRSRSLSRIYRELAHLDLGAGALTNALDSLNRAFEMDPKNGALAMELGELALDLDEEPVANRAFRAVTMMRPVSDPEDEGATPQARAQAYYHMGRLAHRRADVRKAKIFLAKCLNEDPNNQAARDLMATLG
ncbi:MAG: tetratricopeptide repeat protein [Polyangiaceae bacterium]